METGTINKLKNCQVRDQTYQHSSQSFPLFSSEDIRSSSLGAHPCDIPHETSKGELRINADSPLELLTETQIKFQLGSQRKRRVLPGMILSPLGAKTGNPIAKEDHLHSADVLGSKPSEIPQRLHCTIASSLSSLSVLLELSAIKSLLFVRTSECTLPYDFCKLGNNLTETP